MMNQPGKQAAVSRQWLQPRRSALPVLAICFSLSSAYARSQERPPETASYEGIFDSYSQTKQFSGTALVVTGGRTVFEKNYGSAVQEWQIPVSADTKFRIGSMTKQFTAALILLLEEDGRLSLSDSVAKYVTDAPPSWKQITLANLLGQTSGIPEFMAGRQAAEWSMSARSHAEILTFIERGAMEFSPGTRYEYSNSNYEVLGAIIEKVTGRPYAEVLSERILKPLGLSDTGVDTDEAIVTKHADGYRNTDSGFARARSGSMSVAWSAGGMYSTTHDLAKWEQALYTGTLLRVASRNRMTTPGLGSYGLGIEISQVDGQPVYRHGGSIDGFNSFMSFIPAKDTAVIVLANVEGTAAAGMGAQLDDAAMGKPVTLVNEHKAVPIATEELSHFVGRYSFGPNFSLVFAVSGNHLIAGSPGGDPPLPLIYEGLRNGHPTFFAKEVFAELEFIPDPSSGMSTVILHQAGHDETGHRQ